MDWLGSLSNIFTIATGAITIISLVLGTLIWLLKGPRWMLGWLYMSFGGWIRRRRMRKELEQAKAREERIKAATDLAASLRDVANYLDNAVAILDEVLEIMKPAQTKQVPMKRIKEIGEFPKPELLFNNYDAENFPEDLAETYNSNKMRWRIWRDVIEEIKKKEDGFRIDTEQASVWREMLIKARKSTRQMGVFLEIYATLGAPKMRKQKR
ncbi:hypothetical protein FHW79_005226 [Azospirillum sp. OGB3]|uniref:hypothetical protein n=1 Tax=Azospirillum sp. OGB3 TaxID=2587012 RepID=UPI00160683D2|nr:hypothetical protein [Azospirillum sp. OGB3]MBB3267565.1 hypothetical protein [Azospirillum sp. OGB3]